MGKIILLALLAATALTSCKQMDAEEGKTYETVEIEGCEYIQVSDNVGNNMEIYSLTHKGNCVNHNGNEIIVNEENQ